VHRRRALVRRLSDNCFVIHSQNQNSEDTYCTPRILSATASLAHEGTRFLPSLSDVGVRARTRERGKNARARAKARERARKREKHVHCQVASGNHFLLLRSDSLPSSFVHFNMSGCLCVHACCACVRVCMCVCVCVRERE